MLLEEAKQILTENGYELNENIVTNEFKDCSFFIWNHNKEEIEKTKFFERLYKWTHTAEIIDTRRGCTVTSKRALPAYLLYELFDFAKEGDIFKDFGFIQINKDE